MLLWNRGEFPDSQSCPGFVPADIGTSTSAVSLSHLMLQMTLSDGNCILLHPLKSDRPKGKEQSRPERVDRPIHFLNGLLK